MLTAILSFVLGSNFAVVNADTSPAGVGITAIVGAYVFFSIFGRRRTGEMLSQAEIDQMTPEEVEAYTAEVVETVNVGICQEANNHFKEDHMREFMVALSENGENTGELASLADAVATWCAVEASRRRRRLGDRAGDLTAEFVDWVMSLPVPGEEVDTRRRLANGEASNLPPHMFDQCAGYSIALKKLIENTGSEDGALVFGASSNGSIEERNRGCGSVVKNVNAALQADELDGFSIVTADEGYPIVVVNSDMANQLGSLVTAVTLGGVTVVHKLMNLCEYYN